MSKLIAVGVKDIRDNPFRNAHGFPIVQSKVEDIKASIQSSGFWDGYLSVRKNGSGYEAAFGHHRLDALRQLKIKKVNVTLSNLSDSDMIRRMAHENSEGFKQFFYLSVMNPIEAVVQAFADGEITLESPDQRHQSTWRQAPSFLYDATHHKCAYSPVTIANYLGWVKKSGSKNGIGATERVLTALTALQLIEEKILTRKQFYGLTQTQAKELVRVTKAARQVRLSNIDADVRVLEKAAIIAEKTGDKWTAAVKRSKAKDLVKDDEQRASQAAASVAKTLAKAFVERDEDTAKTVSAVAGEFAQKASKSTQKAAVVPTNMNAAQKGEEVLALDRDWLEGSKRRTRIEQSANGAVGDTKMAVALRRLSQRINAVAKVVEETL